MMEGNGGNERQSNQRKKRMVTSDNVSVNLEEELVASSVTIKKLLEEEDCSEICLPPYISHQIMATVIDFCKNPGPDTAWEDEFLQTHKDQITDLLVAADYLKIERLLNVACRGIAGLVKGMSVQQIRDKFGIVSDLTPEEEQAIHTQYPWAFEED